VGVEIEKTYRELETKLQITFFGHEGRSPNIDVRIKMYMHGIGPSESELDTSHNGGIAAAFELKENKTLGVK
jgi:hypothetical protein